jgi:hypothetical protein
MSFYQIVCAFVTSELKYSENYIYGGVERLQVQKTSR